MAVTADRPLTVKQTRFAAAVASGKPKTVARRENYIENPAKPKATSRSAAKLAAQPHVAAEIRRLTWLSCPPVDDIRGMREHAVRVLSDLSRSSPSDEVRLKAALALYRIAETTRAAAAPSAPTNEQDKLLASLRKLYTEVQGAAARSEAQEADPLGPEPAPFPTYDDEPIDITLVAEPEPAADPAGPDPGNLDPDPDPNSPGAAVAEARPAPSVAEPQAADA